MCLTRIDEAIDNPTNDVVKVWKVFALGVDNKLLWLVYNQKGEQWRSNVSREFVPRGKWLKSTPWLLVTNCQLADTPQYVQKYTSGFHCGTNKESIEHLMNCLGWENTVTIPVLVRRITTRGVQITADTYAKVIVAEEMYVPLEGKEI